MRFASVESDDPPSVGDESLAGFLLYGGGDPHNHFSVDLVPVASRSWTHLLGREWTQPGWRRRYLQLG